MTADKSSEQASNRARTRWQSSLFGFAALCAALVVREVVSGQNVVGLLLFLAVVVGAAVLIIRFVLYMRYVVDERLTAGDPSALYIGRSNIYLNQVAAAPETTAAASDVRTGRVSFWTQGQGLLAGTVRLGDGYLRWSPRRSSQRSRMNAWSLPVEQVLSIEINSSVPSVGASGVVTLHLRSGRNLDLTVTNRDRFASAWKRAVDGEDSGPV